MTDTKHQTASEIEREIEQERSALSDTLDSLKDQFSPERMVHTASEQLRTHGGDMAQSIGRAVKENPMALALTGVGIAWLIAGSGSSGGKRKRAPASRRLPAPRYASDPAVRDPFYDPIDPDFDTYAAAGRDRFSTGTEPQGANQQGTWSWMKDRAQDAREQVQEMHGSAREGAHDLQRDAQERVADARDGLRARTASAKMRTRRTRDRALDRASEMMERINEGTENMSEAARKRVTDARMRAIQAQRQVEAQLSRRSAQARRFARDEPLMAGAVALAVGAAIGAALPRTRIENEAVGSYRDSLMDEADRIFHEEAEKLRHVAEAAVSEGQDIAKENLSEAKDQLPHGKEAVKKAEAKAQSAGQRVADAAKEEAERQNLGQVNK